MNTQVSPNPIIEESWKKHLMNEFSKDYFASLKSFLLKEKSKSTIYPPSANIFSAFNYTPFDSVRVVILGQDPYHGAGQANGLCFSVNEGSPLPPSLKNIFKELNNDLEIAEPSSGNLESWARQGVLLLNATLTVRANEAGSHQNKGWENFTDAIISLLSEQKQGLVFLLWGKFAQAKATLIDGTKHLILKAAHPSPFSVHAGFFGCKHFSKTNEFLTQQGTKAINWRLG
jgi:uracil-DNA glycosylase